MGRMLVWVWLASLLLVTGCGRVFPKLPKQTEATFFVWNILYNQDSPPPTIEWRFQSTLNCAFGQGFILEPRPGYYLLDGVPCVGGVFYKEDRMTTIAWPDGATYGSVAFPHELLHAFLLNETGDADATHADPSWGTYSGYTPNLLDLATYGLERFF